MYLDPYAFLSRDEVLEKTWAESFSPGMRARVLSDAEARGLTFMDLLRELAEQYDAAMADPIQREEWMSIHAEECRRQDLPFGKDPRVLSEGGSHDL